MEIHLYGIYQKLKSKFEENPALVMFYSILDPFRLYFKGLQIFQVILSILHRSVLKISFSYNCIFQISLSYELHSMTCYQNEKNKNWQIWVEKSTAYVSFIDSHWHHIVINIQWKEQKAKPTGNILMSHLINENKTVWFVEMKFTWCAFTCIYVTWCTRYLFQSILG